MTRTGVAAALGFAAGLLLRVAILWHTGDLGTPILDEQQFVRLADSLARGDGFAWAPGEPTSLRPPFYPLVLSAVWRVAGIENYQAARMVQVLIAALTSLAVYALGRHLFSRQAAILAAVVTWLYPSLLFFNTTMLTETLFTCLLVVHLLLAIVVLTQPSRAGAALLCGITLGLAALTRSVLWPMPVLLAPVLFFLLPGTPARRLVPIGLLLVGYAVVVAPWAIRNTRLQRVPTIVDTMGGMNLRMGNYEYTPDERMWDAVGLTGEKNWVRGIERDFDHAPTEGEKEKWAQRKALAYIAAHPLTTARRAVIKFADFWGLERELMAGIARGLYSPPQWFGLPASLLVALASAVVMILGAAGAWLTPPNRRAHVMVFLPILLITGVHTIVFGHSRYHVPLVPLLTLYAAALVTTPRAWQSAPRGARIGAAVTVLGLLLIWAHELVFVESARIQSFFG